MADQRIPFAQFGGNFLDLVLTAETIAAQIGAAVRGVSPAMLQAETSIDRNLVRYTVTLGQAVVTRSAAPDAFRFSVELPVDVWLEVQDKGVAWVNSGYQVDARVRFELTAVTLAPLVIFLDFLPVTPAAVSAEVKMTHGGIGEWIYNAEKQVREALQEQLAAAVQKALVDAAESRRVDVHALVRAALTSSGGDAPASPATPGGTAAGKPGGRSPETAVPAAPGDLLADSIPAGGWSFYRIHLPKRGPFKGTLYAQRVEDNGRVDIAVTDEMGGVLWEADAWVTTSGFDYTRVAVDAEGLPAGDLFFRVHANSPLRFKMKV